MWLGAVACGILAFEAFIPLYGYTAYYFGVGHHYSTLFFLFVHMVLWGSNQNESTLVKA